MKSTLLTFLLGMLATWTCTGQINVPDKIFYNGNIITMDPENPTASAIAIQGDKIMALGNDDQILRTGNNATIEIDLDGTTVLPGFVDAHNHLFNDVELTDEGILGNQQLMFENGITTFGNLFSNEDVIAHLRSMDGRGLIKIKSSIYMPAVNNCGDLQGDWWKNYPPTRNPGEKVRIGGIKIFTDGGTCDKFPAVSWPTERGQGVLDLFYDQQSLNNVVAEVDKAGYQLAIHAQGDLAIRQTLEALSTIIKDDNPKKHRIEHNSFVPRDVYTKYGELGIVPVAWGIYLTCSLDAYANVFGQDSLFWLEDWRSLMDANPGLPIAWHSDAPIFPLNPMVNIHSTVTKIQIDRDGTPCLPPDWVKKFAMTVDEALRFMTIHPAIALDRDQEVGSLEKDKFADLVFISGDPTAIVPTELINLSILATMADGEFVFCAEGASALCNALTQNDKELFNLGATVKPNPFQNQLSISVSVEKTSHIHIHLVDPLGENEMLIVDEVLHAGDHTIVWQPRKFGILPGTYFLRINKNQTELSISKLIYLGN